MIEMDFKEFGSMVRKRRKAMNMTIAELAVKSGIVSSYVSKIERGNINSIGINVASRLAQAVHIDIKDFQFAKEHRELDILTELWSSEIILLDGMRISMTPEVGRRLEAAIRMGVAWARELNEK